MRRKEREREREVGYSIGSLEYSLRLRARLTPSMRLFHRKDFSLKIDIAGGKLVSGANIFQHASFILIHSAQNGNVETRTIHRI